MMIEGFMRGKEEEMKGVWDDRMRQAKNRTPHNGGP